MQNLPSFLSCGHDQRMLVRYHRKRTTSGYTISQMCYQPKKSLWVISSLDHWRWCIMLTVIFSDPKLFWKSLRSQHWMGKGFPKGHVCQAPGLGMRDGLNRERQGPQPPTHSMRRSTYECCTTSRRKQTRLNSTQGIWSRLCWFLEREGKRNRERASSRESGREGKIILNNSDNASLKIEFLNIQATQIQQGIISRTQSKLDQFSTSTGLSLDLLPATNTRERGNISNHTDNGTKLQPFNGSSNFTECVEDSKKLLWGSVTFSFHEMSSKDSLTEVPWFLNLPWLPRAEACLYLIPTVPGAELIPHGCLAVHTAGKGRQQAGSVRSNCTRMTPTGQNLKMKSLHD